MGDSEDHSGDLAGRYAELVQLVRHLLALYECGCYADGTDPDDVAFARTWVRAKVRHAVQPGVFADEPPAHRR